MTFEEIREYQLAQLELIKMMDDLCSQLNLTYYIIGGTLLGAVRHKGFIPWDPDIDIAMPRKDYEAVREYFDTHKSERYFYQHYSTEKNHLSPHALIKIKESHVLFKYVSTHFKPRYDGIYLDIFPLDYAPSSKKLQKEQMRKIKILKEIVIRKAAYAYDSNSRLKIFAKRCISLLLAPISFALLNRMMDETMQKYNDHPAGYLVSMASHYSYWKQLMAASIYGEPTRIDFEGLSLAAPAETHNYLTRIYKNYMELPPEDQRNAILDVFERIEYTSEDGKNR
ncbi:MAG: LicD family protein [Clostridia bacterium]|nr:LicD family protein [Clostridia bacterium]